MPGLRVPPRAEHVADLPRAQRASRKPLSDVRVRQALNYATDVDSIVKNVLDGNGRRLDGPFTAGMFGFDASIKGYAPDPARARRLLAEAGYPEGLEITLDAPAGRYQGDKEIAEALGGQWQKAGFRPKVQVAEWGAYFKKYLGKQMQDAYLLGLGGPMQDGDELYNLVSSKGRGLYYKNEKVDELFDQGRSTTDPRSAGRSTPISRALMVDDATWVFLMQQVDIYATRDRLGWTPASGPVAPLRPGHGEVAAWHCWRSRGCAGASTACGHSPAWICAWPPAPSPASSAPTERERPRCSTVCRGLIPPEGGRVRFDGEDITGWRAGSRDPPGPRPHLPDRPRIPRLSVLENLMLLRRGAARESLWRALARLPAAARRETALRERALATARRLNLVAVADAPASDLSGGQKKLLEIGRALMTDPRCILLDEPIAGVNPTLAGEIARHLEFLRAEGLTFLIIEHHLDVIARLCDPVVVMAEGRHLAEWELRRAGRGPARTGSLYGRRGVA